MIARRMFFIFGTAMVAWAIGDITYAVGCAGAACVALALLDF